MSDISSDMTLHGRPKSAWSNIRRRKSLDVFKDSTDVTNDLLKDDVPPKPYKNHLSKFKLKRERSLNYESSNSKDYQNIIEGTDYDSLDEEIEAFNRSKRQEHQKSKNCLSAGDEFDNFDVAWDSLDEEIEAFNREKSSLKEKKRRNSMRLSDPGEDGVVVIEEITHLRSNKEDFSPEVTRSGVKQGIHCTAKRSYSDKGPGGKEKSKVGKSQAQNLFTLDMDIARKNVLQRYNFYGVTDKTINDVNDGKSQKKETQNETYSSSQTTRTKNNTPSLDFINKKVCRPKVKLKPLKFQPSKLVLSCEPACDNGKHSKSTLLASMSNRLKNSLDLKIGNSSTDLSQNNCQLPPDKPSILICDVDDDDSFQPNKDLCPKKNNKKSTQTNLMNFEMQTQPQDRNNRTIVQTRQHMQHSTKTESSEHKHFNNFQPINSDLSDLHSIGDDWNNQSLADFWIQTKKDMGNF